MIQTRAEIKKDLQLELWLYYKDRTRPQAPFRQKYIKEYSAERRNLPNKVEAELVAQLLREI